MNNPKLDETLGPNGDIVWQMSQEQDRLRARIKELEEVLEIELDACRECHLDQIAGRPVCHWHEKTLKVLRNE